MDIQKESPGMLDLIPVPGFCVKDNIVTRVNSGARQMRITENMAVHSLLYTGQEDYAAFSGGCLYLALQLPGGIQGACVNRVGDEDVFLLDQETVQPELNALALAARELREPLSRVMQSTGKLTAGSESEDAAKLNQNLYRMLRIISNMSDAVEYGRSSRQETVNLCAVVAEIMEKAQTHLSASGVTLLYSPLAESIFGLADAGQLERAILNILSNALKFTSEGGQIHAALSRRGRMLYLTITDSGSGIDQAVLPTVFSRYLRNPAIEDSRQGLGLGMVLIRGAAMNHRGTVLVNTQESGGTGITLSLEIRQDSDAMLRSPMLRVDYSGGIDHMLLELSDSLPPQCYTDRN